MGELSLNYFIISAVPEVAVTLQPVLFTGVSRVVGEDDDGSPAVRRRVVDGGGGSRTGLTRHGGCLFHVRDVTSRVFVYVHI